MGSEKQYWISFLLFLLILLIVGLVIIYIFIPSLFARDSAREIPLIPEKGFKDEVKGSSGFLGFKPGVDNDFTIGFSQRVAIY